MMEGPFPPVEEYLEQLAIMVTNKEKQSRVPRVFSKMNVVLK